MWLFFAYADGYIPCGNDGEMKIPARCSRRKLLELAEALRHNRRGRVYLMRSWTQQMSELGPRAFEEYIMRTGELVTTA